MLTAEDFNGLGFSAALTIVLVTSPKRPSGLPQGGNDPAVSVPQQEVGAAGLPDFPLTPNNRDM